MDAYPPIPSGPASLAKRKSAGFFPQRIVKTVAFYITSACILMSVVVCILAIWDFARQDALWRFASSCVVVAAGTLLFAFVNGAFGDRSAD